MHEKKCRAAVSFYCDTFVHIVCLPVQTWENLKNKHARAVSRMREPFFPLPVFTTTSEPHQTLFVKLFIENKPVMSNGYRKQWCVPFQVSVFSLCENVAGALSVSLLRGSCVYWAFRWTNSLFGYILTTFASCLRGAIFFLCGLKNPGPWHYPRTLVTSALHFHLLSRHIVHKLYS